MIDVTSLSAYDLSQKLHSGEISSLDLCKAYLDRIKKFEKDVQAWQFLDKKLLLEKAEEADTYRKSISRAPSLRRKSGVRISMVVPGDCSRMAVMVRAKCPAPPSSRSSRSTEVITTWWSSVESVS